MQKLTEKITVALYAIKNRKIVSYCKFELTSCSDGRYAILRGRGCFMLNCKVMMRFNLIMNIDVELVLAGNTCN